ncbi:MAG: hypothetical protein ACFFF4_11450, partial [Candidatus Thorarchaeota archaeon]
MEPLGTITMYYQFLDKEIVNILDGIMHEAKDYRDFTEQLVDYTSSKDVPINLGFIAAVHVWNIGHYELGNKLQPKFGKFAHIFGWIADSDQEWYPWGRYAEVAMAEDHEDWIKSMVCYLKSVNYDRHAITDITKYMELGMKYIDKNPKLECFQSYLLHSRSGIKIQEGDLEGAIADLEEGIRIARKYDDRYQASVL